MRWFRFAVLISFVTVLQASLLADLNIKPDLLLILLVFFAIYCNTSKAIITSFTIGFAADIIMVGSAMGPQMISFGLFGTALAYLHRVITIKKMPYQALAIFITALLAGLLARFLGFLKGEPTLPNIYAVLFWTSVYSSLLGPFLFWPSAWWMRIKTDRLSRR
ncbi:MAG: rod shape-determining protein MreD [Planctomycetota bacterium]|jgi:rod shape-determining protein MreD